MPKVQTTRVFGEVQSAVASGYTIVSAQGGSRCFGKGTLVRMFDGTLKPVEQIVVGDRLINKDGNGYNTVIETHSGIDNLYTVKQARGVDYVVNSRHVLSLRQTRAKEHKVAIAGYKSAEKRKFERLPFDRNVIHDFDITYYMSQSKKFRQRYTGFKNTMLEMPERELPVDPYYFGAWLGDGSSRRYYEITNIDKEILDWFYSYAKSLGTHAERRDRASHIIKVSQKRLCVPINDKVAKMKDFFYGENLIDNKHVPEIFVHNSYENRLKFLAGLIDTDGCVTGRNTLSISQKNRSILEAVEDICYTCGFFTNGIIEINANMKRKDGTMYESRAYSIEINHRDFKDLNKYIKLPRKRIEKCCTRDYFATSIQIEPRGVGEYYGFTLDNSPYFLLRDGTVCHNSSKTYNIVIWLVWYCLNHPGISVSVVRATNPALMGSVFRDFKEIMQEKFCIWSEKSYNKSTQIYTFGNGSYFEFFSAADEQRLRGRKRDILYCNEANELTPLEWQQLKLRTTMLAIIDYNPSISDEHWICSVNADPRTYHFITTYHDNPFLEQTIIDEIESLKDKNKSLWQVYGLGLQAVIEGLIFKDIEFIDFVPEYAQKVHWRGMDFGYSSDPTAIVDVFFWQNTLYIDEICYNTEMLTSDIIRVLKEHNGTIETISESADPRMIAEIYRGGVNVHPVRKYPGSIEAGIQKMLEFKIKITKQSANVIKEFKNYTWAQDKEGRWLNRPIDAYNHAIDSVRYVCMEKIMGGTRKPLNKARLASVAHR